MKNGRPVGTPGRIALPVTGDRPQAREKVMCPVDEPTFDPVNPGGRDGSLRQQPGAHFDPPAVDVFLQFLTAARRELQGPPDGSPCCHKSARRQLIRGGADV